MRTLCTVLLYSVPAFIASWTAVGVYDCYIYTPVSPKAGPRNSTPPFPGGTLDHVFWFVHLSDLHLSIATDPGLSRAADLRRFCEVNMKTLSPAFVLVTGDLTDAKLPDLVQSQQFAEEWEMYGRVLRETRVLERFRWLDLRGNHDTFDVHSREHDSNLYRIHGHEWRHHSTESYVYVHSTPFGNYSFIGLDACPNPGPRRPFNFFGIIHDEDYVGLSQLVESTGWANHTIWFAHYPIATITTNQMRLRELLKSSTAFLCGHLHELGGYGWGMYGRHRDGHLELELADWKHNRRYRLMAIDHDLFSFVDVALDQWPVVMVTNPKDARFMVPRTEPIGRIRHSTHIRMLIFSPLPVADVKVFIDGKALASKPENVGGPLYVLPWRPEDLSAGQHAILVSAEDAGGRITSVSHTFSVDGTPHPLDFFPTLLLLGDLRSLFMVMFATIWLALVTALVSGKVSSTKKGLGAYVVFHNIAKQQHIHYLLLAELVVMGTGPWCAAELLRGVYGLIFPYGLWVPGHFLPGSLTYLYGIMLLLAVELPFLITINRRLSPLHHQRGILKRVGLALVAMVTMCFSIRISWGLYMAYGWLSVAVAPALSWTCLLHLYISVTSFQSTSTRQS